MNIRAAIAIRAYNEYCILRIERMKKGSIKSQVDPIIWFGSTPNINANNEKSEEKKPQTYKNRIKSVGTEPEYVRHCYGMVAIVALPCLHMNIAQITKLKLYSITSNEFCFRNKNKYRTKCTNWWRINRSATERTVERMKWTSEHWTFHASMNRVCIRMLARKFGLNDKIIYLEIVYNYQSQTKWLSLVSIYLNAFWKTCDGKVYIQRI